MHLDAEKEPIRIWEQVALWLLAYDQQHMIGFLLATHVESYIPAAYIEDSLLHPSEVFRALDGC